MSLLATVDAVIAPVVAVTVLLQAAGVAFESPDLPSAGHLRALTSILTASSTPRGVASAATILKLLFLLFTSDTETAKTATQQQQQSA